MRIDALLVLGLLTIGLVGCATWRVDRHDYGIAPCSAAMGRLLLEPMALQCWWQAAHGRWRTLSHESHYSTLVVNVELADRRDAREIAQRFVDGERATFDEILVYGHPAVSARARQVRRVRWTQSGGFEVLDFEEPEPLR